MEVVGWQLRAGPHPSAADLACQPKLLPGAKEFLEAFWELSTDRPIGFSVGPIPGAAVDRWLDRWAGDSTEAESLRRAIRVMDGVYLGHTGKGRKATPAVSHAALTPEIFDAAFAGVKHRKGR